MADGAVPGPKLAGFSTRIFGLRIAYACDELAADATFKCHRTVTPAAVRWRRSKSSVINSTMADKAKIFAAVGESPMPGWLMAVVSALMG
jgi:hypothetical protein